MLYTLNRNSTAFRHRPTFEVRLAVSEFDLDASARFTFSCYDYFSD